MIDNLVIGTGAAGAATAMALHRTGRHFEMLDVGYDLAPEVQADVDTLAGQTPAQWGAATVQRLFPPPRTSAKGVDRRLLYGSAHPYRLPDAVSIDHDRCATELSHALGGLGTVWGGAMLPYPDHSLRDWPVRPADMRAAYANVLSYVPQSGEIDDLAETFPPSDDAISSLARPRQIAALLDALERRRVHAKTLGMLSGRARVAVESRDGARRCRRCGYCLDGCVYGALFNPRQLLSQLAAPQRLHRGHYALEFKEHADHVRVTTQDVGDGSVRHWDARRVFLGTGQFGTTRLLARSLDRYDEPIRIADSQYFFFPFLSYRGYAEAVEFTLAEVFIEILNRSLSEEYIHFQVYGRNAIFERTLRVMLRGLFPVGPLARRFHLFQGYLHSHDSGHLQFRLRRDGTRDRIALRGVDNPRALPIARRSQALLRRLLWRHGAIPPRLLTMVLPGRSFHTGASFPMGGNDPTFRSDALGRPAGLQRVHIVDAACFPSIAGSSILITIMANADRIARESAHLVST